MEKKRMSRNYMEILLLNVIREWKIENDKNTKQSNKQFINKLKGVC